MYKVILGTSIAALLTACGGGGSSSPSPSESSADLTTRTSYVVGAYALEVSEIVIGSVKQEIALLEIRPETPDSLDLEPRAQAREYVSIQATDQQTMPGTCGGQSVATTSTPDDVSGFPLSISTHMDYQSFCFEDEDGTQIVFDGDMTFSIVYASLQSMTQTLAFDLSYTTNIPMYASGIMRSSHVCIIEEGFDDDCTLVSYYDYGNGNVYESSNVVISGSAETGFDISGELSGADSENYVFSVTGLIPCDNGNIQAGNIDVTDGSDDVINVSFSNCSEFTVTYAGLSEKFSQ